MPNVFGLKLIPVVLATIAFWVIGYLWYGIAFESQWLAEAGYTQADFEASSPAWMGLGVLISLLSVIVIGKVLQWTDATSIGDAAQRTLILWIGFGATMALYGLAFTPAHSVTLFLIDAGHLLVGWLVAAGVLTLMK